MTAINKTDMRHEYGPITYFDSGLTRDYHDEQHGYTVVARAEVPTGSGLFGMNDMVLIENPDNMQYGTWSFDFYYAVDYRWWKVFLTEDTFTDVIAYYEEDVCNESLWIFGGQTGLEYFEFRQLDDPPGETFAGGTKTLKQVNIPWSIPYQIGSWYNINLTRTQTDFLVSINDELVLETDLSEPLGFDIKYFMLLTWYGGNVEFDNFVFIRESGVSTNTSNVPITSTPGGTKTTSSDGTEDFSIDTIMAIAGIALLTVFSTLTYRGVKKKRLNKLRSVTQNKIESMDLIQKTKTLQNGVINYFKNSVSHEKLFLLLLKQQEDEEIFKSVRDELSADMTKYNFLLNPTRLNIMKLLYDNFNLSSIQLKHNLDLSWSHYSHNILAFEEEGYVFVQTEFQFGAKRTIVYLEENGRRDYETLVGLLHEFLQKKDKDYVSNLSKDSRLYPEN